MKPSLPSLPSLILYCLMFVLALALVAHGATLGHRVPVGSGTVGVIKTLSRVIAWTSSEGKQTGIAISYNLRSWTNVFTTPVIAGTNQYQWTDKDISSIAKFYRAFNN